MELLSKTCEICGGDLQKIDEKVFKCVCCKNEFAISTDLNEPKQAFPQTEETLGTITRRILAQKLDNLAEMLSASKKQVDDNERPIQDGETVTCTHQREVSKPRKLTRVEIPVGTIEIEDGAFENCVNLESIVIPDTVICIGATAFKGCRRLENIEIPSSVTHIGAFAFQDCIRLKHVLFPRSVQVMDVGALSGCNGLESLTIPFVGVTFAQEYVQSKEWLDLGYSGVGHFGVIFGAHDYVEQNAVIPPKLESVAIAGGNQIAEKAFWGCTHIRKVTVSKSITFIGKQAFEGCKMLKNVIFLKPNTWKQWDGQNSHDRRPSRSLFGEFFMESVSENILSDSEKAAKALTRTYCNVCLVSK